MNDVDNFEVWETIKAFYREKFGTAPELVDLAPIIDLLRLCASGASNKSIASFFKEPENSLAELFDAHLGFMGWKEDLSFSPLKIYKALDTKDTESFRNVVISNYGYVQPKELDRMYEASVLVERLERLFDEKWI